MRFSSNLKNNDKIQNPFNEITKTKSPNIAEPNTSNSISKINKILSISLTFYIESLM